MARRTIALTKSDIDKAKPKEKDYKLFDGAGLFLLITKNGGKRWRLKYRFDNKEKILALGTYPDISLAVARKKKELFREQIANGINPAQERKEEKAFIKEEEIISINTFEKLARERLKIAKKDISEAHYKRQLNSFKNDAFPFIGKKPIDDVTADDILEILQIMVKRDANESGRKLFYSIGKTFKWAVANRKAKRNPANDILIEEVLGKKSKRNYPTITDDKRIRGLLLAIEGYTGDYTTKMALKLMPYVALRPFNIRHAEWSEIDYETKRWIIPADKMKTKADLIVPLTDSVIKIFKEIEAFSGEGKY